MKYFTILAFLAYFIITPLAFTASLQSFGLALYCFSSAFIVLVSYYWAFVPAFLVKKHLSNDLFLRQFKKSFVVGVLSLVAILGVELTNSLLEVYSSSLISSGNLQIVLWVLFFIYVSLVGIFVISFVFTLFVGSAALRFYEKSTIGVSGNWFVTIISYFYLLFGVVFISKRINRAKQAMLN